MNTMKNKSSVGRNWKDVRKELFTPEEIAESDLRVALIGELINARKEKGITQRELEEISGVKQPVIARMENGSTTPNLTPEPWLLDNSSVSCVVLLFVNGVQLLWQHLLVCVP